MGDSAYNVLGLPDLELVSQHYETRKHQDGYSYDIIVYAVKHVGYVPYCHACQEATGETCIAQKHEKGIRYIKDLDALCCTGAEACGIDVEKEKALKEKHGFSN